MDISRLIFLAYVKKASPEQLKILDDWLRESPRNRELCDYITNPRRIAAITSAPVPEFAEDKALRSIELRLARRRRRRAIRYSAAVCAMLAIAAGAGYMFYPGGYLRADRHVTAHNEIFIEPIKSHSTVHYGTAEEKTLDSGEYDNSELFAEEHSAVEKATVTVSKGGFIQLTLDDGTKVWLNSDTEFTFPGRFTGKERIVTLRHGEAYLEVAHNAERPFIVNYGNGESVRVLGTKFNIQNYSDEPRIVTTLVEGSIMLSSTGRIMRPNEQTGIDKYNGEAETRTVDPYSYIAWINQQYVFNSTMLGQITRQMARWYDIRFRFEDDSLREITFTGTLYKSDNGKQMLDILASTGRVAFHQDGNIITVSKP